MKILNKISRLVKIASYNRDWCHYLLRHSVCDNGKIEQFQLRNGQILEVKREARFILNEIYLDKVYDFSGVVYSSLRSILDLGANVGLFATYIAALNPLAAIYCFEPSTMNYRILCRNIERNKINAKTFQMAVSVNDGPGYLSLKDSSTEYTLVDIPDKNTENVKRVNFEQVFSLCGVERFDLLKCDIEGHEKLLLDNANNDLLLRFNHLIVEWHHTWEELEALVDHLRKIGFDAKPLLIDDHMQLLTARLL